MKKTLTLLILAAVTLAASDIVIAKAVERGLGKILRVNAKIVQLSNQRQRIVSRLGGHLERYFVEPGATVERGEPVAAVKSLELSGMTANYLALKNTIKAARERLASTKNLYAKGLASRQDVNREEIALAAVEAERNTLASQLKSLGIDPAKLKTATDTLTIRAHAGGLVSRLLVPLHTNLTAETPIVSLVQKSGYYALAYVSVADALRMPETARGILRIGDERFECRYLTLLPKVDEETQRAQMLFWIESSRKSLLLDAFGEMEIEVPPFEKSVAVKKSGLTMFEGEWVVFVPTAEGEHGGEEEHDGHEEEGEEHRHEALPYEPRVVKILERFGNDVAVRGLHPGEPYVSDGVWFVKSMALKERMGGHGH